MTPMLPSPFVTIAAAAVVAERAAPDYAARQPAVPPVFGPPGGTAALDAIDEMQADLDAMNAADRWRSLRPRDIDTALDALVDDIDDALYEINRQLRPCA